MIALWLGLSMAWGGVTITPAPQIDVETVVTVLDAEESPRVGRTVSVIHRPGLDGQQELAIGITDARGRVRWTPEIAGVATLHVDDQELDLTVAWPQIPTNTATLLTLLGFAGTAAMLFGLFRRRRR